MGVKFFLSDAVFALKISVAVFAASALKTQIFLECCGMAHECGEEIDYFCQ